jgi:hypothetical protein
VAKLEGFVVCQILVQVIHEEVVDGVLADDLCVAEVRDNKPGQTWLRFGACDGIVACLTRFCDVISLCCGMLGRLDYGCGFNDVDPCDTW